MYDPLWARDFGDLSDILAAGPEHKVILTRGLNPCISMLLTGVTADGRKLACLAHIPAPPQVQTRQWHQQYVQNHYDDCKGQLERQGLAPGSLRALTHARYAGDPDDTKNRTPHARNDASISEFLNARKESGELSDFRSVINDGSEFRTFTCDIQSGTFRITPDNDEKTVLLSGEF